MKSKISLIIAVIVLAVGSIAFAGEKQKKAGEPYQHQERYSNPPTYTYPNPIQLDKLENDRILNVYFRGVGFDIDDVDLETVLVGNIPPYVGPVTREGDWLVTTCFVMRFLSVGGFRPITESFRGKYSVQFDLINGEHIVLDGHFDLIYTEALEGDIDGDGDVDCDDVEYLSSLLWFLEEGWITLNNCDIDNDGDVDIEDLQALIDMVGGCPEFTGAEQ